MKTFFKRITALAMAAVLIFGTAACGSRDVSKKSGDPDTLSLTLGSQPWTQPFVRELREKFPDINFDVEYYTGCNTSEYLKTQLAHNDFGDIYFGTTQLTDKQYTDNLMNLSGCEFIGDFNDSILSQYDIDGAIYQMPCSTSIRTMAYNKTLFDEKGWKVPKSHGDLVKLCKQIRRESDITPISFQGNSIGFYFTTMTTLAQTEFLSTRDGQAWEEAYLQGRTSCKKGFESGISMLQELIDADAYDIGQAEKLTSFKQVMKNFKDRKSAMTAMWGGQNELVEMDKRSKDDFRLFPFYSRSGQAMLGTNISLNIGLARDLSEEGNEKKLENALQVMEWLSSEEGMSHLQNADTEILPLRDADNRNTAKIYRDVWETNLAGLKAPMLYTGYEDIMNDVGLLIQDAMQHKTDLSGVVKLADRIHQESLASSDSSSICEIEEDLTHPETVQLVADALQDSGLADVTLLSDGSVQNGSINPAGASGKVYSGKLDKINFNTPLSRNYNLPVVTRELTGAEIAELIESGFCPKIEAGGRENTESFDYYWSGMDVVLKNGKVKSMTGTPPNREKMDAKDTFTVLFTSGDYPGAGETSDNAKQQKETAEQLYLRYLSKNNSLKAPEVLRK